MLLQGTAAAVGVDIGTCIVENVSATSLDAFWGPLSASDDDRAAAVGLLICTAQNVSHSQRRSLPTLGFRQRSSRWCPFPTPWLVVRSHVKHRTEAQQAPTLRASDFFLRSSYPFFAPNNFPLYVCSAMRVGATCWADMVTHSGVCKRKRR